MKSRFTIAVVLMFSAAAPVTGIAMAGGVEVQRVAQDGAASASPYLPGSPVWGSPYVTGPVLGGVFYDGPSDQAVGAKAFSPAPGVACSLRRHDCWTATGIDRGWTARFFGLKS